jgi:hypothetical protein
VFVVLAAIWPEEKNTFDQLTAPVVALILAILARSAALQIAAFKYGYKKDKTGEWKKDEQLKE